MAACPVGAIAPNGDFNFSACYTHNYREFMGGFTELGRADRRQQRRPGLSEKSHRSRVGVDVAKPLLRGQLQGGLLPERLPGGRGCHRPVSHQQGWASAGHRSPVAREEGDGICRRRFGRRRSCGPPVPPQDHQTSQQWPAAPNHSDVLEGTASHVPTGEGGELERRVPLHLHWQGREAGNRHDPERHVAGPGSGIRARPTCG